jgi:hypothetical protein
MDMEMGNRLPADLTIRFPQSKLLQLTSLNSALIVMVISFWFKPVASGTSSWADTPGPDLTLYESGRKDITMTSHSEQ